jgi:hypothetical protein
MVFNMTLAPNNLFTKLDDVIKKDGNLIALKLSIDNSFLEYKSKLVGLDYIPRIEEQVQGYPMVPNRIFADIDAISMYGTFYLIMIPLGLFMVIFDEMMREKIDKLRMGMQLLGTVDGAYWASWIITAQILNVYMSALMIFVGHLYGFEIFTKTPAWVWFFLFFQVSTAYLSMACFCVTIAESRSQAFTVNFTMILCSMLINMILSEPTVIKKVFFNID